MMIRALLRKQLRELGAAFLRSSKTGKARSRASAVGYALLFAVLVVVLMLCFAGMALPLASVLLPAGLDWLYFASMGLTALLVSVLASAFTSYSGLFQSRDNELLLSLPIPPAVIFGVRVSTVYLACLIYLLMAWVPAVVCYGLLAAHPLAGVLCSIPMALVLAGAACILAVLLGWAVALANDRARHKSLVTVVCSLVFFALYYAGFLRVQEMLDDLLADAAQSGAALARAAWTLRLLGGAAAGELPALVGLALGLVLPNLHWTSEAAVIKMSGCTLLSMAANLVAVLVLTLAQTNLLKILPLPAVMAAALVLLAGADGLLGHWLKTRGARRLAELS